MENRFEPPIDRSQLPSNWYERLRIYDVGMHTGQDTEFYLKKGFSVVAVEANPELCEQARQEFSAFIENGQLEIVNAGVGESGGKLDFFVHDEQSEWSSFFRHITARDGSNPRVIEVEMLTMASILDAFGPAYYVKVDIEGSDGYALRSILEGNYRIPYVSVENGSSMLASLLDTPYNAFKYVQQNNIHESSQANPALEGRSVDHVFEFGASGKFGAELDGEWLAYEEVYELVSRVWDVETGAKNPDWDDAVGGWFDLHARHRDYNALLVELINTSR